METVAAHPDQVALRWRNDDDSWGEWTFADLETTWQRSVAGIEALVRAAGLGSPRYVRVVREAYVLMMHEVMEAMAQRPDE